MKAIYSMLLSSVCAFAIDCTTIDIEAERTRLQMEMDVMSSLTSPIRVAQRKEIKAFEKCLLFHDLKKKDSYQRAKALQSLSKLKSLTYNEKKVYKSNLKSDIAIYKKFDFSSIGHKNVKHIFYFIEESEDNEIIILEFFSRKNKIKSTMDKISSRELHENICKKDTLTKTYIEELLDKEFQCEIPASQEFYNFYVLSEVTNYLLVAKHKILKGTEVAIVKATDKQVVFRISNEKPSKNYVEKRDRFDKYFKKVDLLALDNL